MNMSVSKARVDLRSDRVLQENDEIDLLQIWMHIWRRKWSVIGLTGIVMMLTLLVVLNMTPIYRAVSTLLVEQSTAKAVSIEEVYGLTGNNSEYLQTQFELLKSRNLAERVVKQLSLQEHPEFDPRQQGASWFSVQKFFANFDIRRLLPMTMPEDLAEEEISEEEIFDMTVRSFMEQIEILPVTRTQLVKIQIDMADREMAAKAANALAEAYIESQLEARMNVNTTATTWMNQRLLELGERLKESEKALQTFREQENLVDVAGVTTVSASELSRVGDRLADARRLRLEAESRYNQVRGMQNNWERLMSAPEVIRDPLVKEFRAEEARAQSRVQEMSRRYGAKHPQLHSAQTDLASATQALRKQIQEVVSSIERDYQLSLANERSLQDSYNRSRNEIQNISREEFRLKELERQVETNRQLYETFLTRLKETSATQDFEAVNARVVERAVVPPNPVKPNKTLIVLIAGVLAGFVGVALALLIEVLNNTFKSSQDVETHLNLPVLGITPMIKDGQNINLAHHVSGEVDRAFSESVRTVRTSIVLSGMEHNQKVLLLTSSVPGEGKSTLAANLSGSLSKLGKVLLIDADLRRPTLRKRFELPVGQPGIANYIAGTATLEECIFKSSDNFDLITAGAVPPNPQELLASPRFAELIAGLRDVYDHIIIDSPPALAVADSVVLSQSVDGVIYVIKSLSTSIPMAQRGVGHLLQNNAALVGVVLNQVDIEKAQKYGYSYGGYYDYYGYNGQQKS